MPATLANALKAHIEAAGLGVTVHRDTVTRGSAYPLVKIQDALDVSPDPIANAFDSDSSDEVVEMVQVELLEQKNSPFNAAVTESPTLANSLHRTLNGATLTAAPMKVYGLRVAGRVRIPDMPARDEKQGRTTASQISGVVRHVYTVLVKRNL